MVPPEVIINEPSEEEETKLSEDGGGVQPLGEEPSILNSDVFYLDDEKDSTTPSDVPSDDEIKSAPPRLLPNSTILMKALTLRNLNNRRRFHSLSSYAGMEMAEDSFCR